MQSCDHEQADHVLKYALANGSTTCLVRTVDTDVVVIIIALLTIQLLIYVFSYWKELHV